MNMSVFMRDRHALRGLGSPIARRFLPTVATVIGVVLAAGVLVAGMVSMVGAPVARAQAGAAGAVGAQADAAGAIGAQSGSGAALSAQASAAGAIGAPPNATGAIGAPGAMAALRPPALPGAAMEAPLGCLIEPSVVVDVGSPVIGVLERVSVERGDVVSRGQVLAQLDAVVERAAVAVAMARFQGESEMLAARSAQEFAAGKRQRDMSLYQRNFISAQALEESKTEAELAARKLEQATESRMLAAQEVKLARAQLAQRTITAPVSGVVVERYMQAGERVEEKPILRIARIDPLRVEVILPANRFGTLKSGMKASVEPDLAGSAAHEAEVTVVDRVLDAASNTFRVRLDLPNPDGALPAGLRCKVKLPA